MANGLVVARRMSRLQGEGAIEVFAKAKALEEQGADIIHLEIGEPDFTTPAHIVDAGIRALKDGKSRYTPAPGIPQLREAVAEHISKSRGIDVSAGEVIITPGSKTVAFFTMLTLVEPNDEVIHPDPGFPVYESVLDFLNAKRIPVPMRENGAFRLDIDYLLEMCSSKTKLIILNSPQNPTGAIVEREDLEKIAQVAVDQNIYVLSDEIYSKLQYDSPFISIAAIPGMKERTIILDGFSKSYAMTGWRLGYGVIPKVMFEPFVKLAINSHSCTAEFVQFAGIEALTGPQDDVDRMASEY